MSPFSHSFRARWVDMDFNQHMRNAAFLGCAEETRMRFMDSRGWTMKDFESRQLGPVVLEDKLTTRRSSSCSMPSGSTCSSPRAPKISRASRCAIASSEDRKAVDEFHAAALAAAMTDDGLPGVRQHYHPNYYGAFVKDASPRSS